MPRIWTYRDQTSLSCCSLMNINISFIEQNEERKLNIELAIYFWSRASVNKNSLFLNDEFDRG